LSGWLSVRLTASPLVGATSLTFQSGPNERRTVHASPGRSRTVRIPVCAARDARVIYSSKNFALLGRRAVSVRTTEPVFIPSRAACSAS